MSALWHLLPVTAFVIASGGSASADLIEPPVRLLSELSIVPGDFFNGRDYVAEMKVGDITTLNVDPAHNLDVVATDFGAPTDFAFSLVTPFLFALTGNVDVFGLASINGRDSAGAPNGGTITPDVLLSFHFVDHVIFGSGAGEAFAFSLLDTAITYPVDDSDDEDETVSFVFDCGTFASGECAAIGTFIGVGGAGGGDGFSVLTTLRVTEIPAPSALALLGFGLVGIGAAARRVQRA